MRSQHVNHDGRHTAISPLERAVVSLEFRKTEMTDINELEQGPRSGLPDLTVKLESKLLTGMLRILGGINMTEVESENGWWETITGAQFGNEKLLELVKFMSETVRSNIVLSGWPKGPSDSNT